MKTGGIIKIFAAVTAGVLLLLAVLYNILLSDFGIRSVVLPLAGSAAGCEISAEKCSISLFSSPTVTVRKLAVSRKGELELRLGGLNADAPVWPLLAGGNLHVRNFELDRLDLRYNVPEKNPQTAQAPGRMNSGSGKQKKKQDFRLPVTVDRAVLRDINISLQNESGSMKIVNGRAEMSGLPPENALSWI